MACLYYRLSGYLPVYPHIPDNQNCSITDSPEMGLAPVPHEKGRDKYGGSYFEDFEWWRKPRHRSLITVIKYMALEILLLRAIWKHNPVLWPLSLAFHTGIYLVILAVLLSIISALMSIGDTASETLLDITSVIVIIGYILGGLGAICLIVKRIIDANLRPFSSFTTYFNLLFLLSVFITGLIACRQQLAVQKSNSLLAFDI